MDTDRMARLARKRVKARSGNRRRVGLAGSAAVCLAALLAVALSPARADARRYTIAVPDRQATSFVLDLDIEHPGTLVIEAEWLGSRVLSFRVEGPGYPTVRTRRSGPSPQRLEALVGESDLQEGGGWRLVIRALPAKGRAEGTITVRLPFPEEPAPTEKPEPPAPTEPPPDPEPWAMPATPPSGAAPRVVGVYAGIERFRFWVAGSDGVPRRDACGWQEGLLRYLAGRRDDAAIRKAVISEATGRYLGRLVNVIRGVEEIRSSSDPILAGPAPGDRLRERAWLAVRRERIEPIEAELDFLTTAVRRGFAPELEGEEWPSRFVSCMTACERYFERRVLLGEGGAPNRDLALDQWDGFLAASAALEALAALHGQHEPGSDARLTPPPAEGEPR
jgi:hypothetical protein